MYARRGGGARKRARPKGAAAADEEDAPPQLPTDTGSPLEWDPFSMLLVWAMDPANVDRRTTHLLGPVRKEAFHWPWTEADGSPSPVDAVWEHSSIAVCAVACVTALVTLERFAYLVHPPAAFAARAARAAWMPMFTQVLQERSPLFNGLPTVEEEYRRPQRAMRGEGQAVDPLPAGPTGPAPTTNTWYLEEIENSPSTHQLRRLHTLWPDPDGVLTWEQLPNRTDVLHELRLWALHNRPLRSNLALIMDKAMPYRSNSRRMGYKFTAAYDDPPPLPPPATDGSETPKKRAEAAAAWQATADQAAEFRFIFNQISWCTFQGLYARAHPPSGDWAPALAAHRAWTAAGPTGVARLLGGTGLTDARWHMVVLVVLREYFTAMLGVNRWYVEVIQRRINVQYLVQRTQEMANALRASVNSTCDMRVVITALQPYKQNNKKKQVYRYARKSCLKIVRSEAQSIISSAMALYIAVRTDMLPRLRKGLGLLPEHVARIAACTLHLKLEEGPDVEWLRRWVAGGDVPPTSTPTAHPTPLMAALDALCVRLAWPLSGQAAANIWNFLARCSPSMRTFVAPFTQPELGGLSPATAKIIQSILLSDPIALGPKRIKQSFKHLPLWDARVLVRWARTVGTLNGIRLIPQPQGIMESAQWAKWRTLEDSYGTYVAQEIVVGGGVLGREVDEEERMEGLIAGAIEMEEIPAEGGEVAAATPDTTTTTTGYHPHPSPALPEGMWTVLHTRCCDTVSSKQTMERIGYHLDMGCLVCSDGIPKRHSAPPASTDANKSRRIVDSMRPRAHYEQFHRFWEYTARTEQGHCALLAGQRWAAALRAGSAPEEPLGPAVDVHARLDRLRASYETELRMRVAMAGDIIKEEKRDGQQLGSHRTARTLVMLAGEMRALQTGDPTYRVPLAESHDVLCESPRSAVSMGFWWIAEHQLLVTHGNAPPTDPAHVAAFWQTFIPDPGFFIDRALQKTFHLMDTNLRIGGKGTAGPIGSGSSTPRNAEWDKFVRSARSNSLREACVNVPVQPIYARGLRLVHGCEDLGVLPIISSHCPACGAWKPENRGKPWGWLAGLWVCHGCAPVDTPEHKCTHRICKVHHPHGSRAIVPLLFHRDSALQPPPGVLTAQQQLPLPLWTPYVPGVHVSPDLADGWTVSWWCRPHHGGVSWWAMYWASLERASGKLLKKKITEKLRLAKKFHGIPKI